MRQAAGYVNVAIRIINRISKYNLKISRQHRSWWQWPWPSWRGLTGCESGGYLKMTGYLVYRNRLSLNIEVVNHRAHYQAAARSTAWLWRAWLAIMRRLAAQSAYQLRKLSSLAGQ